MYELRVLTGLHQGAALPLIGEQWTVGASDDDDLSLFEPGLTAAALSLQRNDQQWLLNGEPLSTENPWQLGHVWLTLSHVTTPWQSFEPPGELTQQQPPSQTQLAKAGGRSKWSLALLTGAVVTLSTWAISIPAQVEIPKEVAPANAPVTLNDGTLARNILRHMLKNRDLASVTVNVSEHDITLAGTLVTEDELQRLGRMLERFKRKYHSLLPVINQVQQRQFRLPFRITQVTTGPMAHLVTDNGNRLFVGDEVEGIRLVEIANNRIIFGGKFQLEMAW